MRVLIASRIFAPEPAAASFRLLALANALVRVGAEVTVLTSRAPAGQPDIKNSRITVKRWPVLRDRDGYVRGYLPYLSFDVPLFFRLLFARNVGIVLVEPPPTTGIVVLLATWIKGIPYAYYAADIWSDAIRSTGAAPPIVRFVRTLELHSLRRAAVVISVSEELTNRLRGLGVDRRIETIGNGTDLEWFARKGEVVDQPGRYFVYAGTASEVHGAQIFVDAFARIASEYPDVKLVFIGQGSERREIEERARALPVSTVLFKPRLPPAEVAAWLRNAVAALGSVRPGIGYDFAFPTKLYAAVACGTPVIYSGVGPGAEFVNSSGTGLTVEYEVSGVSAAMSQFLEREWTSAERDRVATWAFNTLSLDSVADRGASVILAARDYVDT